MRSNPRTKRFQTNASGTVVFDAKECLVVLRNKSDGGVRLRVIGSSALPDAFRLKAPLEKIDQDCAVVWRKGVEIGASFRK